jgi:hypothetical protein
MDLYEMARKAHAAGDSREHRHGEAVAEADAASAGKAAAAASFASNTG